MKIVGNRKWKLFKYLVLFTVIYIGMVFSNVTTAHAKTVNIKVNKSVSIDFEGSVFRTDEDIISVLQGENGWGGIYSFYEVITKNGNKLEVHKSTKIPFEGKNLNFEGTVIDINPGVNGTDGSTYGYYDVIVKKGNTLTVNKSVSIAYDGSRTTNFDGEIVSVIPGENGGYGDSTYGYYDIIIKTGDIISVEKSQRIYFDGSTILETSGKVIDVLPGENGYSGIYNYYDIITQSPVNEAPSAPGNFVLPYTNSVLTKGKKDTVYWGESTDPDGDNITYSLETSYNGGTWSQAYFGSYNTTEFAPTANSGSVQFRVRATDSKGANSAYTYSNYFNINNNTAPNPPGNFTTPTTSLTAGSKTDINWGISTDPDGINRYNYSRYNLAKEWAEPKINESYSSQSCGYGGAEGYTKYSWDKVNKKYIFSGEYLQRIRTPGVKLYSLYGTEGSGDGLMIQEYNSYTYWEYKDCYADMIDKSLHYARESVEVAADKQGSLVQSGIVANDGTYPTNGKHTDGYWYVRNSLNSGISISYYLDYETNGSGNWKTVVSDSINNQFKDYLVDNDETIKTIRFRVRAKDQMDEYSGYTYSNTININHAPTLIASTISNQLLFTENPLLKFMNSGGQTRDVNTGEQLAMAFRVLDNKGNILINTLTTMDKLTATGRNQPLHENWYNQYLSEDMLNQLGTNKDLILEVWVVDDKGLISNKLTQTFDVDITSPTISIGNTKDKIVVTEDFKLNINVSAVDTGPVKVDSIPVYYGLYEGDFESMKDLDGPGFNMFSMDVIPNASLFLDSTLLESDSNKKILEDGKTYTLVIFSSDDRNPLSIKQIKIKIDSTGLSDPTTL